MPMQRTKISRDLRSLIRLGRTDVAKLSQQAAADLADISEVWWRQIETGRTTVATADTLARMSYVVGVTPRQLRKIKEYHVADLVELRNDMLGQDTDPMEDHLMATPDLTDEQRVALITLAKVLRSGR